MGSPEVRDQVEGMKYLMQERPYIDPSRICVTGWSYGGYLSLMCLAQQPHFFKVVMNCSMLSYLGSNLWSPSDIMGGLRL